MSQEMDLPESMHSHFLASSGLELLDSTAQVRSEILLLVMSSQVLHSARALEEPHEDPSLWQGSFNDFNDNDDEYDRNAFMGQGNGQMGPPDNFP